MPSAPRLGLGRYRPYRECKVSGVEWLGEIPAHWDIRPLFTCLYERHERNPARGDEVVLSLSYGRLVPRDLTLNFGLMPATFETYQLLRPSDIVLRLTDLQNDKTSLRVGRAEQEGIITSAYVALMSTTHLDPVFAFYVLNAYDLMKVFYNFGAGVRQTMDYKDLKWFPVLLPPLPEQRAIAAFLDRETAKFDALVAKVQEGIERLKEYRIALISAAVTGKIDVRQAPIPDACKKAVG
jgi:type I restriction enzyme S subunit